MRNIKLRLYPEDVMEIIIPTLEGAFVFSQTPQGAQYWNTVINNLKELVFNDNQH